MGYFTLKVSAEELKKAAKDPGDAAELTRKYAAHQSDSIRTSLLNKDLKDYQEGRKALKRKAEAKGWTPAKKQPWKAAEKREFEGGLGRFAKSGQ